MINVYLDDYRPCPEGFVLALNVEECVHLLSSEDVDILSLDYDLGWSQPTGIEVVKYIVDSGRYPKTIYIHTSSAAGRQEMSHLLREHAPFEVVIYNGPMDS